MMIDANVTDEYQNSRRALAKEKAEAKSQKASHATLIQSNILDALERMEAEAEAEEALTGTEEE